MKQITYLIFVPILLLSCIFVNAQENDILDMQRTEIGKIKFAKFKVNASSNRKMKSDTVFLKSILQAKKEDSFRKIKEDLDELGITHKKFQHYYKGLRVENSEFLIHGKKDNIEVINGDFWDVNVPVITPSLNEKQALTKALVFVGSKKYKWEDIAMEKFVKQNTNNPNASYYPKGELVISKDYLKGSNLWKLSWKFTISSMEPNNEQLIYVDANDGNIINDIPLISDANVSCSGQTIYSGPQNIIGDSFTSGTRLQESRSGVNIQTLNLNSTYNYASAADFVNSSISWIAGSWTNFNADQAALDAHWGAEKVFDFWGTVFTRNSINGAGLRVLSYVHAGSGWANAQWVGGSNSNFMQYGDGNSTYNPLVSLDVSAHEFGHGITQFTANLTPGTQESGALNEGFSDIWGACVEHWAAPNKQTWLMGEGIFKTETFDCIRNLQNPKSTSAAEGQHPDTYHGSFWSNVGEPHCNSTVLSHWFYLLSQGSNGVKINELKNSYYIGGISIENAQKIAYRAESLYLNSSADYSAARNATIQAAADLASSIPNAVSEVTNAWYAVGVGNQYQYTISGPSQICTQGTYTIDNLPAGATVAWSNSSLLKYVSGQGTNSYTVQGLSQGSATLTATLTMSSGNTILITYAVWIGKPSTPTSIGGFVNGQVLVGNGVYNFSVDNPPLENIIQFNWTIRGGTITNEQNTPYIEVLANKGKTDTYFDIKVNAQNTCGCSDNLWLIGSIKPNGGPIIIDAYPNPASSQIEVNLADDVALSTIVASPNVSTTISYAVKIIDSYGCTVYSATKKEKKFTIPTTSFRNGVYSIIVSDGTNTYQNKLIIKH